MKRSRSHININCKYKDIFSSEPVKAKTSGLPQAQHRPALTEPEENMKMYLTVENDQKELIFLINSFNQHSVKKI
jgi:hypothetical protein